MADIRNDQYLHRPGAGRGAITPADPMEVRLYGPDGEPISAVNRLPVEATLTGSTEVITLVDAEAIREESPTGGVLTDWIPLDGYRDWEIYVSSTLDAT